MEKSHEMRGWEEGKRQRREGRGKKGKRREEKGKVGQGNSYLSGPPYSSHPSPSSRQVSEEGISDIPGSQMCLEMN